MSVYNETIRMAVKAVANDNDAKVKIEGNEYVKSLTGTITITVSNGVEADSVYHINWDRALAAGGTSNVYSFTSAGLTVWKVPYTGKYKLEVWGAQGGNANSSRQPGGYGAYSVGVANLTGGQEIYIGVGGQGASNCGGACSGGYNGGGSAKYYSGTTAGGGGATHIAINNNELPI